MKSPVPSNAATLDSFHIIVGRSVIGLETGYDDGLGVRLSTTRRTRASLSENIMEIGAEIVNLLYPGQAMRDPGIARKRSDDLLYRMERSLQPPRIYAREEYCMCQW